MQTTATTLYPFVPSGADFEVPIAFFSEIGFAEQWRGPGIAGLRFGGAYFLLQEADVPEWQQNQMITFEVTDLDGYWAELAASNRVPCPRSRGHVSGSLTYRCMPSTSVGMAPATLPEKLGVTSYSCDSHLLQQRLKLVLADDLHP